MGVEKDPEPLLQSEVGQIEKAGAAARDGVRQPIDNPETDAPIHHRDEARPQHQHRRVAQHRADDKGVEIEKIGGAKSDLRWRLARDQRVRDDQHGGQQGDLHQQNRAHRDPRAARPGSSDPLTGEAYNGEDKNNPQVIDGPAQWYRCQQVEGDD